MLGVAQLMVILDNTIVNIALPTAQHDLGLLQRRPAVDRHRLLAGLRQPPAPRRPDRRHLRPQAGPHHRPGRLRRRLGHRRLLGRTSPMLVIARTVQGAFGALLAPSVLALLTTTFHDPGERGKAFGIYGGIAGAGGALGLLLGGILTSYASWRWTLFVNLAFAAVATTGALLWLKNDKAADHDPLDFPGLFTVTGGLFSPRLRLLPRRDHGVEQSLHHRVPGPRRRPAGASSPSSSHGSRYPLLPLRVVARPDPRRLHAGHAVRQRRDLRRLLVPHLLPAGDPRLQPGEDRRGLPPHGGGPGHHGPGLQPGPAAQVRTQAHRARRTADGGGGALHAARARAAQLLRQPTSCPTSILLGFGFGLSLAPSFSTGTLGLPPHDAGVGSAALNTTQQVGGSIGTALLNTLAAGAATAYLVGPGGRPRPT